MEHDDEDEVLHGDEGHPESQIIDCGSHVDVCFGVREQPIKLRRIKWNGENEGLRFRWRVRTDEGQEQRKNGNKRWLALDGNTVFLVSTLTQCAVLLVLLLLLYEI